MMLWNADNMCDIICFGAIVEGALFERDYYFMNSGEGNLNKVIFDIFYWNTMPEKG